MELLHFTQILQSKEIATNLCHRNTKEHTFFSISECQEVFDHENLTIPLKPFNPRVMIIQRV